MKQFRRAGICLLIAFIGFIAGKFHGPAEIRTIEVERVVYRRSSETQKDVNKKEIIKPDGTKIIETISTTKRKSESELDKEKSKELIQTNRPNWLIGVTYQPNLVTIQGEKVTIHLQRRLFSEFYGGLSVSTDKTIGVSLSIGF